ncbi:MAG TPA: hypothetical protein VF794_28120 [Archangium sp.]|uniref:hypothetical protein n=1 Tax=Archangium sp. TaxID=1872627 RepID=UPI002EDBB4C9
MRIDFDTVRRWRRLGLLLAGAGAGLLALPGHSGSVPVPELAACCSGAAALGDTMINASGGGDKDFFEVPSSPPSAIFLIGDSESMLDFPEYLPGEAGDPNALGCSDPALVAAMDSWFDKSSPDPLKNGSVVYDADADFGATPQFFDPTMFYASRSRRIAWNGLTPDYPYALNWDARSMDGGTDTHMACYRGLGYSSWSDPRIAVCKACLASKGWYRGPLATNPSYKWHEPKPPAGAPAGWDNARFRTWVLSGRVLNVRPPKFVVARKVLKDVINNTTDVRMGVATFGPDKGWYDPPVLVEPLRPSCDKSFPTIDLDALDRPKLMKAVNKTLFRNDERSIGEALFGLGGYFSSHKVDQRWLKWFQQPIHPGWGWPGSNGGTNYGTIDNPFTGQTGKTWAVQSDEWVKFEQPFEVGGNERSVCFSCQVSSVIVLADGPPVYDNSVPITKFMQILKDKGAKHPDGTPLTFDPSTPETNTNPGGVNYCDQFEHSPGVKAKKEDCDYSAPTSWNWPTGLAKTNKNFMDDVAFFLANADLRDDMPGAQAVRTYTIGYGNNNPMLQSIALAGKGSFYRANNATELRESIMAALGDLKQTSTSFASANISGVQASGMNSSVYIPRFVPRKNRPYEGHLYRYFFFNEFAQGCEEAKAKSATTLYKPDLNGDKDCNDSFFVDKPASMTGEIPFTINNIVQENVEGNWVKVVTATVNSDGKLEGGNPAVPFWDAGDTVGARSALAPCDRANPLTSAGRCIFTMIDRNNDGKFTDVDNPPVEFTTANLADLKQYLLAAGDTFCNKLFARQKKAWTGSTAQQDECTTDLIKFIRGVDVLDFDGDSILEEERPCADNKKPTNTKSCKLADIFHSTPVTVEPPVDPFLCSLGLSPQCLSTLYQDFSASVTSLPLCGSGAAPCYKPTPMNPARTAKGYGAYDDYRKQTPKRDRVVLVGSNGGMLHAFHAGSPLPTTPNPTDDFRADPYDQGTGQELWAFIPPDLLPKLGQVFFMHQYFVDGTPMVRDIWVDGAVAGTTPNGIKEAAEFRTLAVITERGGGQRYIALDMTNPYEMLNKEGKPFRWMFPNSCDPESATMGQTWSNYTPKPPPIGAVRLKPLVSTPSSTERGWEERWVTVLNGGFSADLSRGRGLYMVDAWSGQKLWSAEARPAATSSGNAYQDTLNHMMPIVASAAMMDIGKAENVQRDLDGFFDTLTVGDLGGQMWTFRFFEPGERASADAPVTNWFGARSLEMARQDTDKNGPVNLWEKAPFTNIASNVLQPETGWLRTFVGTGDRQHLRTSPGSDCGPDDLLACVRLKCDVKATFLADINGIKRTSVIEYVQGALKTNSEEWSGSLAETCSASKLELTDLTIACPDGTTMGSGSYMPTTAVTHANCEKAGGAWSCKQTQLSTGTRSYVTLSDADKAVIPHHRYFGYHAYGGSLRKFKDSDGAVAFDKLRMTDKAGFNCGKDGAGKPIACSLVDVTIPSAAYSTYTVAGKSVRYVPTTKMGGLARGTTEGPGWFLSYEGLQERTAAGSTVIAGVVSWPSFAPLAGSGASACVLSGVGDVSNLWQADAITGLPDQSEGYQMRNDKGELIGYSSYKSRPSGGTPPGDVGSVVAISKSGGIKYGWMAPPGPGDAPTMETNRTEKNVTPDIYWLEVPRNLHVCRHENAALCSQ